MHGFTGILAAAIAFVGSHFLLSHPLRAPVSRIAGKNGFTIIYVVVAFATLGWLSEAYRKSPPTEPLWPVGDGLWALATIIMLLASVLLMGSVVRNPALPGAAPAGRDVPVAKGVFAITRHPMMWSFALWGLAHILVYPLAGNIVIGVAIIVLALVGAALQDRKKEALEPGFWPAWEARTSYWPFAAIAAGRARAQGFGMHALAGGVVVWLAATWAHIPIAGWPAGIWRWIW